MSSTNYTKDQVEEVLKKFVLHFAAFFKQYITEAVTRHEEGINKSGKYADFFNKCIETVGKSGCEAIGENGEKALALTVLNLIQGWVHVTGNKINKNNLAKLLYLLYDYKKDEERGTEELVKTGIEIFYSMESQIMQISCLDPTDRDIRHLAEDMVSRIIQYCRKNMEKEFKADILTYGLIHGKSKKYKHQTSSLPKLTRGHTVRKTWNTSDMINEVGILHENSVQILTMYKMKIKKCKIDVYGCRLSFEWENLSQDYEEVLAKVPNYTYVLAPEDFSKYQDELLIALGAKELEKKEKDSIHDLLAGKFENYEKKIAKHFKKYLEFSENNQETILMKIQETESELIKEIRESGEKTQDAVASSTAEVTRTIKSSQHQVTEKIGQSTEVITTEIKNLKMDLAAQNQKVLNDVNLITTLIRDQNGANPGIHAVHFGLVSNVPDYMKREEKWTKEILDGLEMGLVVLAGFGGVGKTELALEIASSRCNEHTNVLWISSQNKESIFESFKKIASYIRGVKTKVDENEERSVEAIAQEIYAKLTVKKTLLVFDDAENVRAIEHLLPAKTQNAKFDVIITSRSSDWKTKNETLVELTEFTLKESLSFIRGNLGLYRDEVKSLETKFQYHPLALHQAIIYIRNVRQKNPEYKIREYLIEFDENPLKFLNSQMTLAGYSKNFYQTIELTMELIQASPNGEKAMEILDIISYALPNNIPVEIFSKLTPNKVILEEAFATLEQFWILRKRDEKLSIFETVQLTRRLQIQSGKGSTLPEEVVLRKALAVFDTNDVSSIEYSNLISVWSHAHKYREFLTDLVRNSAQSQVKRFLLNQIMEKGSEAAAYNLATYYTCPDETLDKSEVYVPFESSINRTSYVKTKQIESDIINLLYDNKIRPYKFWVSKAAEHNPSLILQLFSKGADLNAFDSGEEPPIQTAIRKGELGLIEMLNIMKADFKAVASDGKTCTHKAAILGNVQVFDYLVRNGYADFKTVDEFNATPLHYAAKKGEKATVVYIVTQMGVQNLTKNLEDTMEAQGSTSSCIVLEERNPELELMDDAGKTPAHWAALYGQLDIVQYFLEDLKWSPSTKDEAGWNLLHFAASSGQCQLVQYLLGKGLKPYEETEERYTALSIAQNIRVTLDDRLNKQARDTIRVLSEAVQALPVRPVICYTLGMSTVIPKDPWG